MCVCVVRMDGNTACERVGESVNIDVKSRDRIKLKWFYEVMIHVYSCGFTRTGDMSQQMRPLIFHIICLCVVLWYFKECKPRRVKRRNQNCQQRNFFFPDYPTNYPRLLWTIV